MKNATALRLRLPPCVLAGLFCLPVIAAPTPAPDDPIRTEQVMELRVALGPTENMGKSIDGDRVVYPIVGGTFSGKGIRGTVVPGGGDFFVEHADGTGNVDALYRLRTDDGVILIIHNKGIYTPTAEGRRKDKAGEKLTPADQYCRTVPEFIAPVGKYDWLTKAIFVGSVADGDKDEVIVRIYRVQ